MTQELEQNNKLDEEFKTCLQELQPYVTALKWTKSEIKLCQEWLHKLLKIDEKSLRNAHLAQFIMQLKNGEINKSFNKPIEDNKSMLALVSYLPTGYKTTLDSGDGLTLNNETKMKLESIEKLYEELKMKNEFLVDQVQLFVDRKKLSNDHINIINSDLGKVKNKIDTMCTRINNVCKLKAAKESENLKNCKIFIDKTTTIDNRLDEVLIEVKNLKLWVGDACENKKMIDDLKELLEYMKQQHEMHITENQQNFDDKIYKLQNEVDQLKAYANIKMKESGSLEEIIVNQNLTISSYKESMKCVEEFLNEKNINID